MKSRYLDVTEARWFRISSRINPDMNNIGLQQKYVHPSSVVPLLVTEREQATRFELPQPTPGTPTKEYVKPHQKELSNVSDKSFLRTVSPIP